MSTAVIAGGVGGAVGGLVGGTLGAPLGPVGIAIGRYLGSAAGKIAARAAAAAIANMMEEANEDAEAETKEEEATTTCADCGDIDCFTPPESADTPEKIQEFKDQLQAQQDGINNTSPSDLLRNMDNYVNGGRAAGDAAARATARANYIATRTGELLARYLSQGMDPGLADAKAKSEAASSARGLDVLHSPDLSAGGTPGGTTGLGLRGNNRSIGAQWNTRGPGSDLTRREQLRANAESAKADGANTMNVELKMCEDKADAADPSDTQSGAPANSGDGPGTGGPGDAPMS